MKRIVRNRADARLLPSRRDFAIFRFVAWMRLRHAEPAPASTMYFTDRHQSAAEMWTVGLWLLGATTLYVADALSSRLPSVAALVAGFFIAGTALQAAVVGSGLLVAPLWRRLMRSNVLPLHINGPFVMALFLGATTWGALRTSWVRYVAWSTIAVTVLNLIAAVLLYVFRDSIAKLESSIVGGGSPSAR